jgi:hypothetical protein
VFGGFRRLIAFGDTWVWDGDAWREHMGANPSPRLFACADLDAARGMVVLFGGELNGDRFDETWEFDGTDWALRTPAVAPRARFGATLCSDSSGRSLLFAGQMVQPSRGPVDLADLWAWDGTTWTSVPTPAAPPARLMHAAAFDTRRGRLVVFGGLTAAGSAFGDTWEFDGSRWSLAATSGPLPSHGNSMVFDPVRGRCVLLGLHTGVMEWDGATWSVVEPPIPPPGAWRPSGASMLAYDPGRRSLVAFGDERFSATWEFALDANRARLSSYGVASCSSVLLTTVSSTRPVLGTARFPLRFAHTVSGAPGAVVFDLTARSQSIQPGCSLYVSGLGPALLATSDPEGVTRVDLAIPNLPSLAGWEFYAQCVSIGGPVAGQFALSSGVGIRVGW